MKINRYEIYTKRAVLVSLFCNVVLVSIKLAALILVNSLAIAVDLGISFVGLTISVILFYSIKMAGRPADPLHNYGYGKIEHVCEILEGIVLIGIAIAMISQASLHLLHPRVISNPWIGLGTCIITSSINFGGAFYIFKMANKSKSPAIHAEAIHYRMEGYISGMIGMSFIIAILLNKNGLIHISPYVDPGSALLVSFYVIVPSFKLAKSSFFNLLDASVEEDSQIEILKKLSHHITKYCEFKDLKTRSAGIKKFVEFSLIVPHDISLEKAYKISNALENDIKKGIPNCSVTIKMIPCDGDCEYVKPETGPCPYK